MFSQLLSHSLFLSLSLIIYINIYLHLVIVLPHSQVRLCHPANKTCTIIGAYTQVCTAYMYKVILSTCITRLKHLVQISIWRMNLDEFIELSAVSRHIFVCCPSVKRFSLCFHDVH